MNKIFILFASLFLLACSSSDKSVEPMNEAEILARVQQLTSPGDAHKNLAPLVGNWKATSKFWIDPSQAPEQSITSVSRNWILDGRFVQEIYVDKNPKQPFEGIGMLGYDNIRNTYISNWVDTMGTGVSSSSGTASPNGDILSFCLLYTSPSPRDATLSRMPSSA